MRQKVIELYEMFFQITSGYMEYTLKLKKNDKQTLDNFLSRLTPSHGEDWLFDYFSYQFSRYFNKKTRFGRGIVMIGWILGSKAWERYNNASDEEKFYGKEFVRILGIKNPIKNKKESIINKPYLDNERTRFRSLERQLLHCKELDLYNENSKICKFCKNKKECQ